MAHSHLVVRKLFLDKHGKLVVGQKPNIPIIIWVVCALSNKLVSNHDVSSLLSLVGTAALVLWATLEVGWGVNYFRRLLGIVVLAWIVMRIFG